MKKLIFISFLMSSFWASAQHAPLQSQYMFNGVALNPAYTGSEDVFSIIGSFRAQWVGFPGAPLTQSLTAHAPLKGMNAAVGLQVYGDQIGITKNTGVFGSYAYRLRMRNSTLVFGAAGGVNFIKSNFSQLQGNDAQDQLIMNDSPLGIMPDFSFGMHYYAKKYFVSLSLPQFLSHEYDGMKFRLRNNFRNYNIILGGGYLFETKSGMKIKPSVLGKYKADSQIQFDINLMATFNKSIEAGLSYRTKEAIVGLIKINATDQLSFMYSFGLPLSPIFKYSFGSHEISVKYNFLYKSAITSPRFLGF